MTRTEVRLLPIGVGLLGASAVLLELLTFRLVTATISRDVAVLMSLLAPAVAGVGGMLVARRAADTSGAGLDKSAAHLTALAGTFACLAIIGLTYASQRVANAGGEAGPREVVVTLFACLLPFSFHGAALAVVMRRGAARIGRYGFIAAVGGALACIALPWLLDSGAPRALIVTGFLLGVAALLLAHCGSEAEPRTAVMWTLPLAATALIAGDIGAPWLKLRLDTGRRSNLEEVVWTPQGAIGVDKVRRLKSHLRLDRYDAIPLAEPVKEKRKPPFKGQDLIYLTSKNDKGPVLVVGSVGGREAAVALAEGHPHVDAMEQHGALVNDLLRDRYARLTGNLYRDDERVTPLIGDGLRSLDALGREYQHVVVMAEGGLDQSPPRFLTATERMLTVEALRRYLLRLREDGSMLVRAQLQALPALFAAAKEALVEVTEAEGDPDQHLLACVNARTALLVATRQPLDPMLTRNLQKRCQRSRLTVEFPLAPVEGQPSPTSMVGDLTGVKLPEAGRPYALANPPLAELPKAVWPALQTLGPAEPLPEGEKPKDDDEDEEEGEALSHPPGMIQAGL
ncbi:MAG: hypothetical protein KC731_43515, partial [Myxococcales bacterium]|nr:hypothetical protein [Myxococcales bacterium]